MQFEAYARTIWKIDCAKAWEDIQAHTSIFLTMNFRMFVRHFCFCFFFGWNRRKNRYRSSRIGERRKEVLCFLLGFSLSVGKPESDGIQQLSSCRGVNFDVYIRKNFFFSARTRPTVHFHYFVLFSLCCRKLPLFVRYDIVKCSAD